MSPAGGPTGLQVHPAPTAEEAAAIVAALAVLWPGPAPAEPRVPERPTPPWRFSGRWWVAPAVRRRRPAPAPGRRPGR